jgi:hypothetical protein
MEFDLDIPCLGDLKLARFGIEAELWIGEGAISILTPKTGISRLLSCFNPSEEGFQSQVDPLLDVFRGTWDYTSLSSDLSPF